MTDQESQAQEQTTPAGKGSQIEVPQEWVETASVLRSQVPFYTSALGVLPLVALSDGEGPACTDGRSIMVVPSKWDEMRQNTLDRGLPWFPTEAVGRAVLLCHEIGHIIFRSESRMGGREAELWNQATDFAINEFVVGIFQAPPFNYRGDKLSKLEAAMSAAGCYDKKYFGKTAEEIYDLLKQERDKNNKGKGKQGAQGAGGGQSGQGQRGAGPQGQQPSKGKGQGQGQQPGQGQGGKDITNMHDGKDFGGGVPDSGTPKDLGELIDNELQDYVRKNQDKMHNPNGNYTCREMNEAAKKPPVPLSEILKKIRDVIPESHYDYRRVGKNDAWQTMHGLSTRLPSSSPSPGTKVREIVVVIDASGSMSDTELACANRLVMEAFKHVKGHKVRRIVFTTQVVQDDELTPETKAPIHHTGGTHIASIIPYFDNPTLNPKAKNNQKPINPSVVILLTDACDSEDSIRQFEKWKHLSKLRTIILRNPHGDFPGVNWHCDTIE